jgi:hypothetical protein
LIRLQIEDDDAGKLDLVLGQAHRMLGDRGDMQAQGLLSHATLTLRRDGGYFHPIPGDSWTSDTYEAVLTVAPQLAPEFTNAITDRIWESLGTVLSHHGRDDVHSVVIEQAIPALPGIAADWRDQSAGTGQALPTNQARHERTGEGFPAQDGLVFTSRAELSVYQVLMEIQREFPPQNSIAVLPLPGAKLRDAGVRTPDFVVLGNGPGHYGKTRR